MRNELQMRLSCIPSNVAVARIALATFAGSEFGLSEVEEVKIAVSEAVSNAVLHAYPDGDGKVEIRASLEDGVLSVDVVDFGVGIPDVAKAKEPGFTTIDEHMGLGFSFIESFMEEVRVESEAGRGTRVFMVKRRCP
ncbi:MAG: anti-sigma F factor [Bacillota bacterium]|jgi:stage II sporulation protein AB (anti-sigma F factor)